MLRASSSAAIDIFVPFGENTRYDLVTDDGPRLRRVQCKTGRLRDGAVRFPTCSSYAHHANPKRPPRLRRARSTSSPSTALNSGPSTCIPIEDVPNAQRSAALRVDPPRNRQTKNIRLAAAYEIARVDVY